MSTPIANLKNCVDFVDDYEKSLGIHIIGVRKMVFDISYAVLYKDGSVRMVSSNEVKKNWPNLLQNFLVDRIKFPRNSRIQVAHGNTDAIETKTLIVLEANPPTRIIGDLNRPVVLKKNNI